MGVKVRQRKGAWWLYIDFQGQRRARRVGDRKAAELAATKIRAKLAEGDLSSLSKSAPSIGVTFSQYAETWLTVTAGQTCKFTTSRVYASNLTKHINPAIGSKALKDIVRADLRILIASCRAKGLSPKSIENVSRTVSSILTQAVEDGHLTGNPAFRLGKHIRQGDHMKPEIRPFTREEAAAFLAVAKDSAPREYPLFMTALRTGMRLGELLGLEWGDIDFAGRFIEVRRNRVAGRVTTPKSGKGRRIDMSSQLTEILRGLLTHRKEERLKRGWSELPDAVFCTEGGTPLDGDNLRHRVFYKTLDRAGLRRIRFHDLRHTFATLLIQNGESLAYIRDQLGHSSIQITVDTYGHLVPGANRQAVDRLDDAKVT